MSVIREETKKSFLEELTPGKTPRVFIIAEAEVNHNGSVEVAKKMIVKAKEIGCDAIKFQTYVTENFVYKNSPDYGEYKDYELDEREFRELKKFSEEVGIVMFTTAVEVTSVPIIKRIGFPIIKIGSSNISNVPLLEAVAGIKRPVLLSTGGSTIGEIHKAVEVLESNGASEVGLLHCVLQYPTKPEDVNLRMLLSIQKAFPGYPTGFSDHTMGISASPAAVVLGVKMIEKHFTLDVKMQGPDHAISASPEVMGHMVKLIREVEKELGSHKKGPIQKEKERLHAMRRRIVAACDVSEAGLLTQENIVCMRREDGKGVDSWRWHDVIGKRLKRGIRKGDPITWEDIF